jgi:chorismate mutase-like protein
MVLPICAAHIPHAIPGFASPPRTCISRLDMSSPLVNEAAPQPTLAELRKQLDAIDDQLHNLLMQRAQVVERVALDPSKPGLKIRPGREAAIIRRLLARNAGTLPAQAIMRLWRELFATALIIEGGQTIAVCATDDTSDLPALAREHFGPLTALHRHRNPTQALADIERGTAQVAVLPPPSEEPDGNWWTALMGTSPLSVIAKLPFWTKRAEGAPTGIAYAVAAIRPDPSGQDRGLIALELNEDVSRTRIISLLTAAGFTPGQIWLKREAGDTRSLALIEVEGLVEDSDERLRQITGLNAPASVIGGYAVPLELS